MKKIITHNGLFHADEVFAVALIHEVMGECKVERTRNVSTEELDNPDIWVLDQYGQLDEAKHNFDHHQDPEIESTNVLILDYLYNQGYISAVQHDKLEPMFKAISSIDRKGYDQPDKKGFQVNYLIKTLNNIENNFDIAVLIARTYIRCELESIKKAKESAEIWDAADSFRGGQLMVCSKFPIFWKSYIGSALMICPDADEWALHSANTKAFPIQTGNGETFIHTNKFLAKYPTKEKAVIAAFVSLDKFKTR